MTLTQWLLSGNLLMLVIVYFQQRGLRQAITQSVRRPARPALPPPDERV